MGSAGLHAQFPANLTSLSLEEIHGIFPRLKAPFALAEEAGGRWVALTDPFGLKPLFFARANGAWAVAETTDDISQLLPGSDLQLNESSVVGHISGPYSPRREDTFFSDISAVPPGSMVQLGPNGVTTTRLWDPSAIPIDRTLTLAEAASELRRLIQEVASDYVAEGPGAVTVSSGMDSTSVIAGLVEAGADVSGITWASAEIPEADESHWARLTCEKLGVPLLELQIDASTLLPDEGIVTRPSSPFINMFDQVWRATSAEMAKQGRQTMYTGLSGDHLFGGWVSPVADSLVTLRLLQTSKYLSRRRLHHPSLLRTLRAEILSPLLRQALPRVWARRQQPVPWLHDDYHDLWRERQAETVGRGLLPGRGERVYRLDDGLISQLSADLDHSSEAEGINIRHPLLDRRLVEFAISLPTELLNDGTTDKLVLREAMSGVLPDEVVELDNILPGAIAQKAMRARADRLLALTKDMRSADLGFVYEPALAKNVAGFMRGDHDNMDFWNTLTLEDWLRRWW
ncbi:MAG: asparagine synthetase B family protein [Acidimicrobiia bacterium]